MTDVFDTGNGEWVEVEKALGINSEKVATTPEKAPETAEAFLRSSADLLTARAKQYDSPGGERSMGKAVEAFNAITDKGLTEAEGWLLLQVLKDVRQWQRKDYHPDSAEDCIAYAALKAEALSSRYA